MKLIFSKIFKANNCLLLLFFSIHFVKAQVPQISYSIPNSFNVGMSISPISPVNSGGMVSNQILVTTYAGSGLEGSTNGNGVQASFNLPTVVTADASGIVYVVDRINHLIRKITTNGDVTTFAGSGLAGSTDGLGTAASFNYPDAAVVDSNGNLFVTDQSNHKIRKITPEGLVSTFAGSGTIGATDGQAINAKFYYPAGIAVDANNNLLVADYGNNKIRKITPEGLVSTFAGSGVSGTLDGNVLTAQFNGATGVCVDSFGTVFVADYFNNTIRKIDTTGKVTTLAGNGTPGSSDGFGANASFHYPAIIAVDAQNNLFITDEQNHKIRKILVTGEVTTYAGTGNLGATDGETNVAEFHFPTGVFVDVFQNIYIADYGNNKIRKIKTYGYSIVPTLPAGLVFDANTGTISGTPTTSFPATNFTVTASNISGESTYILTLEANQLSTEEFQQSNIKLYPNPVDNTLQISSSEKMNSITVLNILGQEIKKYLVNEEASKIDFSTLESGIYWVKVKTISGVNSFKISRK